MKHSTTVEVPYAPPSTGSPPQTKLVQGTEIQTTVSPFDQSVLLTRPLLNPEQLDIVISDASKAQKSWKKKKIEERIAVAEKWMVEFEQMTDILAQEITLQMGRPISQAPGEIKGTLGRARYLIDNAKEALQDVDLKSSDAPGFKRYIKREPIGVVGVIAPWNFPYLTMINSVLPAILAGNAVIIKPSPQTPTPAERLRATFKAAGLPPFVIQVAHLSHSTVLEHFASDSRIGFISFTGSVLGGKQVARAAVGLKEKIDQDGKKTEVEVGFKGLGLELGGKDPAYVRSDVDVKWAAAELVDGAMFNSGQSCCGIERIYVHSSIYDDFIAAFVDVIKGYKLGDPRQKETNLGPVVSLESAARIRKQVADAIADGAQNLVPESEFAAAKEGSTMVGPQVLVDVTHQMDVMMAETFGPVVGIMKVESDEEALSLMNDSPYGLTASVWTNVENADSLETFDTFVNELECGTVFLNRCDYLDPACAWTGVKNSGRGVSLSKFGFDQLTQPKSVHMKIKTT